MASCAHFGQRFLTRSCLNEKWSFSVLFSIFQGWEVVGTQNYTFESDVLGELISHPQLLESQCWASGMLCWPTLGLASKWATNHPTFSTRSPASQAHWQGC